MISVYLAGPSSDIPRVMRYASFLESSGRVTISLRWWEMVLSAADLDRDLPRELQRRLAVTGMAAIARSQILWCLWPDTVSHGAAYETGVAYARMTIGLWPSYVVITGARSHECIFSSLVWRDSSDSVGLVDVLRAAAEMDAS